MNDDLKPIFDAVVHGDRDAARSGVQQGLAAGVDAKTILDQGLIPAMTDVGQKFEDGEYFLPEMLVAARAMQGALEDLQPHLVAADVKPVGRVVAGTVQGDLHDIGKNLVCIMLQGAGFAVDDLGVDVSPAQFVDAVRKGDVDIVSLSALLTTTMPGMQATIEALREAGLRDRVKVLVGGAPLTEDYAREIGADGYAEDASRGAKLARSIIG